MRSCRRRHDACAGCGGRRARRGAAVSSSVTGADRVDLVTHSTTQAVNALPRGRRRHGRRASGSGAARPAQGREANPARRGRACAGQAAAHRARGARRHRRPGPRRGAVPRSLGCGAPGSARSASRRRSRPTTTRTSSRSPRSLPSPGLPVCTSSELTGLYGLELRAVTAAINASIIPIALGTADIVERGVADVGISSPGHGHARRRRRHRPARLPARAGAHALLRAGGVGGRGVAPHRRRRRCRGRDRRHVDQRRCDQARPPRALLRDRRRATRPRCRRSTSASSASRADRCCAPGAARSTASDPAARTSPGCRTRASRDPADLTVPRGDRDRAHRPAIRPTT